MYFSPKIQNILFGAILVVMSVIYYDGILEKGPLGAHGWRQADCLSLTQNYQEGAPFLEPEMHILLADNYTTGKSAGEFPIMYYTVGKIWQVFGKSYLSYRLFYLLIFLVSLFLLYKATLLVLQDWVWAASITLLTFCSPNFVAYATSFITDGPAICFVFIGLFFITKYGISRSLKWFYFAMAFFALAGLIKVSSLIAFFFLGFIFLMERFSVKSLGNRKLFSRPMAEGIGFLAVLVSIFAWYAYAEYYNTLHGFKYTFNSIDPFWQVPQTQMDKIVSGMKDSTSENFFSRAMLFALLFLWFLNLFLRKHINFLAYSASLLVGVGCLAYFALWFPLLKDHNYYFVVLVILVPAVFIPFALMVKNSNTIVFKAKLTRIFLGLFLFFNMVYSVSVVKLVLKGKPALYPLIGNSTFITQMEGRVWGENNWRRFESLSPHLLEMGIKPDDKVISLPDPSFNITLAFADRRGWTDFLDIDADKMNTLIEKGAKYLFVSEEDVLKEDYIQPFITDEIGVFEYIHIYRLPKPSQ